MKYGGREIADISLWELGEIFNKMEAALVRREKASQHKKFDKDNNKQAMEFPPVNPEFLKMMNEIELAIKRKQGS